jgi:uncharacterized YceG family protein
MSDDQDDPQSGRREQGGEPAPAPAPRAPADSTDPADAQPPASRGATPARGARHPRPPHPRSRYRRRRLLALLVLVVAGFAAWFLVELFQPFAGGGHGSVTLDIPSGADADQIGDVLAARGVVSSSFFFALRARIDGDGPKLRHGVVTLRRDMSYAAALNALTTASAPLQIRITIPEGYTRRQIAALAAADGLTGSYLIASRPGRAGLDPTGYGASHVTTLEGFLFPATYFEYPHANVSRLISQQIEAFRENFGQLNLAHARAEHLTPYDVLIIASMVEREAQVPGDRRLVAAVIYNRLAAGMTLGIDATLRYALGDYSQPLTQAQLELDSPYNTRLHRGLPPTPISNPGLASMVAAADPARVPYLYYVDEPNTCGKLAFSTSYAQFEADVAAYDAARRADGGRAPTKCP